MKKTKSLWYGLDENTTLPVIEKIFNLNYSTIFMPVSLIPIIDKIVLPKRMNLAFLISSPDEISSCISNEKYADKIESIFTRDLNLLNKIRETGKVKAGLFMDVKDRKTLDDAVKFAEIVDVLLIEFTDPTNIPLELVLATTQNSPVNVFKKVKTADDGFNSFMTMEKGSDGIMLMTNDLNEIITLDKSYTSFVSIEHLNLVEGIVTRIAHAGMGDRVCIDTTSELFQDEGMLLGSTSSGSILTCSETHYLPYMNLRPFRVNAGGLHLYVWGPNNRAYYLSDLKSGDCVFVVNSKGQARVVTIGRIKIERRPLLLIECEYEGVKINTFIQDDWHVRLMGAKGEIRPSSEIKIGDKLLCYLDKSGRHVGIKINESIKEV
ncbi:MAG: hypothetical protein A2086_07810 [Spirochaetes bacterium GWD1_27_9]|nr:MAG: hypothetical protein A2Z98_07020 [Spirochaetes bacterium GWB1_27_13]OHD21494.1 MAG: hypothetical protein A2Y34_01450 [Spirochaetes bacterium GWC1_27_15]OHD44848.1 MAG: hypothetical protein A2086_07810 [Spirochaetes bacterium GWD1_27_9]